MYAWLVALGCGWSTSPRETFAARVVAALESSGARCLSSDAELVVRCDTGLTLSLATVWDEIRAAPAAERAEREERFLAAARAPVIPSDLASAAPQVFPRIRSRAEVAGYPLLAELDGDPPPDEAAAPYAGHLASDVVLDLPLGQLAISDAQLAGWGADRAAIAAVALQNLRALSPAPFRPIGDGVYAGPGDAHDAARLLLVDEIRALPLEGRPVAMPTNRDQLLLAGSDDLRGLARLGVLGREAIERPRWLGSVPIVLGDEGWEPFEPPTGPAGDALRLLTVQTRAQWYADQRAVLEPLDRKRGITRQVGMVGSLGEIGRGGMTYTSIEGGVTLLPEVDLVAVGLAVDRSTPVLLRWDSFAEIVGPALVVEPGLWPVRWSIRTDDVPDVARQKATPLTELAPQLRGE